MDRYNLKYHCGFVKLYDIPTSLLVYLESRIITFGGDSGLGQLQKSFGMSRVILARIRQSIVLNINNIDHVCNERCLAEPFISMNSGQRCLSVSKKESTMILASGVSVPSLKLFKVHENPSPGLGNPGS